MSNQKKLVDRRKHKRFQLQDTVFATLLPDYRKTGKIIDVSMGGLAFQYISELQPATVVSCELAIFSATGDFHLSRLSFVTISDFENARVPFSSIRTRRCGLQFGELTGDQTAELVYFLDNYTISKAEVTNEAHIDCQGMQV
jgi:hypothetical protein